MFNVKPAETQKLFANVETAFNYVGYVCKASGAYRMMFGQLQVIGGLADCAIKSANNLYSGKRGLSALEVKSLIYVAHGATNIGRGYVETFAWWTGIGLLPLLYDLAKQRFAYDVEKNKQGQTQFFLPTLDTMKGRIQEIPGLVLKGVSNAKDYFMGPEGKEVSQLN